MLKRLLSLMMCLAIVTATTFAFAEDVYITAQGKKYHKQECSLIQKRNPQKVTLDEAKAAGLEPCKKCFKSEDKDSQAKSEEKSSDFTKQAKKK